ncbi:MAG: hypothetical protein RJA57_900, partial [Bacteroidota bacterium]
EGDEIAAITNLDDDEKEENGPEGEEQATDSAEMPSSEE